MRFLIESRTRADIFFVGAVLVATAVELEGVYPQPSLKVVPRAQELGNEKWVFVADNWVREVVVSNYNVWNYLRRIDCYLHQLVA